MSENFNLNNKFIKFYMDGGWEFLGKVLLIDSEKYVISCEGENIVIYKGKVSAAKIVEETDLEEEIESIESIKYNGIVADPIVAPQYNENNYFGSIIPEDMLKEEKGKKKIQNTFSVSMQQLKNVEGKIKEE